MYKISLKQKGRVHIDGKWREYGKHWNSEKYIDSPLVNCILIKSKVEKKEAKPKKSIEVKKKKEIMEDE